MKKLIAISLLLVVVAAFANVPSKAATPPLTKHICIVYAIQQSDDQELEVNCDGKNVSRVKGTSDYGTLSAVLQGVINQGFHVVGQSQGGRVDTVWTLEKD